MAPRRHLRHRRLLLRPVALRRPPSACWPASTRAVWWCLGVRAGSGPWVVLRWCWRAQPLGGLWRSPLAARPSPTGVVRPRARRPRARRPQPLSRRRSLAHPLRRGCKLPPLRRPHLRRWPLPRGSKTRVPPSWLPPPLQPLALLQPVRQSSVCAPPRPPAPKSRSAPPTQPRANRRWRSRRPSLAPRHPHAPRRQRCLLNKRQARPSAPPLSARNATPMSTCSKRWSPTTTARRARPTCRPNLSRRGRRLRSRSRAAANPASPTPWPVWPRCAQGVWVTKVGARGWLGRLEGRPAELPGACSFVAAWSRRWSRHEGHVDINAALRAHESAC